jgi:hypothetical protein
MRHCSAENFGVDVRDAALNLFGGHLNLLAVLRIATLASV